MSFIDYIERLRAKPDYVRKQVAFLAALSFTGIVTLLWGTAFLSSGVLSITPVEEEGIATAFSEESGASLLSAIGSLTARKDGSIVVVGTQASSTAESAQEEERTTIPF